MGGRVRDGAADGVRGHEAVPDKDQQVLQPEDVTVLQVGERWVPVRLELRRLLRGDDDREGDVGRLHAPNDDDDEVDPEFAQVVGEEANEGNLRETVLLGLHVV